MPDEHGCVLRVLHDLLLELVPQVVHGAVRRGQHRDRTFSALELLRQPGELHQLDELAEAAVVLQDLDDVAARRQQDLVRDLAWLTFLCFVELILAYTCELKLSFHVKAIKHVDVEKSYNDPLPSRLALIAN